MDYTTGVLDWSEAIEAQYGMPPGTFGDLRGLRACIHPDDREPCWQLGSAMKTGSDFSVLNRDGPDGRCVAERRRPLPPR